MDKNEIINIPVNTGKIQANKKNSTSFKKGESGNADG